MKRTHAVAIGLVTMLDEIQAPRDQDEIQAPRGQDRIETRRHER